MAKERSGDFATTLRIQFMWDLLVAALFDDGGKSVGKDLSVTHDFLISFKQCSFFVVNLHHQHYGATFRTLAWIISKSKGNGSAPVLYTV